MNIAIADSPFRYRFAQIRRRIGTAFLLALIAFPVIGTELLNTIAITHSTTLLLWGFVAAMLPETINESKQLLRNKALLVSICTLGTCVATWLIFPGSFDGLRCLFMIGVVFCLPAAIGWFRQSGARSISVLIWAKACVVAYASFRIGVAILQQIPAQEMFNRPPVYRHLRHFNYDLSLMSGLALGLASRGATMRRYQNWLLVAYFAVGFFSFWSGGRGGVLAVVVMLFAWWLGARTLRTFRVAALSATAFVAGGLAVIASGRSHFLLHAFARSSKDTLDGISSNRLGIWMDTWTVATSNSRQLWFGHAPEAFINLQVYRMSGPYITHPHSALLQWILEYGLLGTAAIVLGMLTLGWQHALPHLRHGNGVERSITATVIGMTAFSLVDGIYYHAAPLVFLTILLAYLISRPPSASTPTA